MLVPAQHELMHQFLLTKSPSTITESLVVLIIYKAGTVLSEVNVCHIAGFP